MVASSTSVPETRPSSVAGLGGHDPTGPLDGDATVLGGHLLDGYRRRDADPEVDAPAADPGDRGDGRRDPQDALGGLRPEFEVGQRRRPAGPLVGPNFDRVRVVPRRLESHRVGRGRDPEFVDVGRVEAPPDRRRVLLDPVDETPGECRGGGQTAREPEQAFCIRVAYDGQ